MVCKTYCIFLPWTKLVFAWEVLKTWQISLRFCYWIWVWNLIFRLAYPCLDLSFSSRCGSIPVCNDAYASDILGGASFDIKVVIYVFYSIQSSQSTLTLIQFEKYFKRDCLNQQEQQISVKWFQNIAFALRYFHIHQTKCFLQMWMSSQKDFIIRFKGNLISVSCEKSYQMRPQGKMLNTCLSVRRHFNDTTVTSTQEVELMGWLDMCQFSGMWNKQIYRGTW